LCEGDAHFCGSASFAPFGTKLKLALKITVATATGPNTTLAVTYDTDWVGIECTEEGEISVSWCWSKFNDKVAAENLTAPPAFLRTGVKWEATIRQENNSIRAILKEAGIWTPEDPGGPPPMTLFGPSPAIKVRTSLKGSQALTEMIAVLGILYQNRYVIEEEVPSREWAVVGSFGGGEIPIQYRLPQPQMTYQEEVAANATILESGLKTQNSDKGLDKYVRKFDPAEESSTVVSIHTGWQGDHGWAVAFKQRPRRCLLLDTTDGLTD
jgi:hypothetical protein